MNFDEFIQEIYRNDETILTFNDDQSLINMMDMECENAKTSNEGYFEDRINILEQDLNREERENERLMGLLEDNNIKFD